MSDQAQLVEAYKNAAVSVAELVAEKQLAYGNAVEKTTEIIKVLYPNGIPIEAYPTALIVVRIIDKLMRIATSKGKIDQMNESPFQDILGYSLLALSIDFDKDN